MPVPELLQRLLTTPGPSGHESDAARVWRESCAQFSQDVGVSDSLGSSYARVAGSDGGPTLAVVGHIDEIGLLVTHIDPGGYLHISGVGGWDPQVLIAQRVSLQTRGGQVAGVIGRRPIHLLKDDDRKKVPELKDLRIDIGAQDADEAHKRVRIGDVAVIDSEPLEFPHDRLLARSIDNRMGCFVAAEVARIIAADGGAPGDVLAVAAAQEETGLSGARTSAFAHRPDVAIVVDVTHATDQPGVELGETTEHKLGSGPVIARGTNLHPHVFELLYTCAEEENIPFTLESLAKGTGTDADVIHISRSGIPTGLVSVPCRYMHSPVEMVSLQDVDAAARLVAAFAKKLVPGLSFER
ncbi:MAG: M42 family metallopeptidase [Solirubrobacteraceae bacterium]